MAETDKGELIKMEVDYSSTCDEQIPVAEQLAKDGKLDSALETLMALEKQTRLGADNHSLTRVLVAIMKVLFEAQNWTLLNENIIQLSKRRSQLKQSLAKMIQEACSYVDKAPDKETKLKYIETLRTVTEGKIYVEVERARLTHKLSLMKEAEGNVEEAANVLQELQVETFGSMERKEKVEMILEQMRLCLLRKDYIRAQIIAKKINPKFFDDEAMDELKLKYYDMMIQVGLNDESYLETCKHHKAIYNTASVKKDEKLRDLHLKSAVVFLLLAPHDPEQNDMLLRTDEEKGMEEISSYKELLKLFITPELIRWNSLKEAYEKELRLGTDTSAATGIFSMDEGGDKRWESFHRRVIEHNIRIMAKYYTKVTLERMSELLELEPKKTEKFLSDLVTNGTVSAKTDRPLGIVCFSPVRDPTAILNEWSNNLNSLMSLVGKTNHLINKEEMVHKHLLAAGGK